MKNFLNLFVLFLLGCSLAFTAIGGREAHRYKDEQGKIEYETKNNLYDGHYCSYYKNGNKKCEGQYVNNNKTGEWKLYDSIGHWLVKRTYENNYVYSENYSSGYGGRSLGHLKRNENGFYDYPYLNDSSVLVFKRIWRHVLIEDCPLPFSNVKSMQVLVDAVIAGKITAYGLTTDEYGDTISKQNMERLVDTATMIW
jgi:hypothetical protein